MENYFKRCLCGPQFLNNEDKKFEFRRFLTFSNWPNDSPVFPLKLSKAGFCATGNGDEVACFKCGVKKLGWVEGDEPFICHRLLSPDCSFMSADGEDNIPFSENIANISHSNFHKRLECVLAESKIDTDVDEDITSGNNFMEQNSANGASNCNNVEQPIENQSYCLASKKAKNEVLENEHINQAVATLRNRRYRNEEFSEPLDISRSRSSGFLNTLVHSQSSGNRSSSLDNEPIIKTDNNVVDAIGSCSESAPIDKESQKYEARISEDGTNGKLSSKPGKKSEAGKSKEKQTNSESKNENDIPPPTNEGIGPLRFERNRLQTFHSWPSNACVAAAPLAKSGFCYTGTGDRVQCIFCKGVLRNWEYGDQPHIEHRKHFPRCSFVLGLKVGNVPLPLDKMSASSAKASFSQSRSQEQDSNVHVNVSDSFGQVGNLGIITDKPKHPLYAIEAHRLVTFQGWPQCKNQTPQHLAEAGFWYAGFGDNVKCFYCDGGLRNWEAADSTWEEHARWFPHCPFVKQVKGQEFINNVLHKNDEVMENPLSNVTSQHSAVSAGQHEVEERAILARMDRPYIKKIEDLGISRELIMTAIRKRLQETGDDFPSVTTMLEEIFKMQANERQRQSQNTSHSDVVPQSLSNVAQLTAPVEHSENVAGVNASSLPPSELEKCKNEYKVDDNIMKCNKNLHLDVGESSKNMAGAEILSQNMVGAELQNQIMFLQKADDLLKENLELKEQKMCKICMTTDANVVFLPCGHLVSCASCAPALQLCPICRGAIAGIIRTYIV